MAASSLTVSRWLLAAISSLSPFGISIMVPLVPMLSMSMAHSVSELQYLFSIYVIGLAVSQPIFGLITDRIGRRTVLLSGFGVFVFSSILLMFADTLAMMILLRFLQAVGVGVGTVVARGIIRDHLPPDEALKAFALLTAAMGFTPVIAPVVGGFLAPLFGLKSVFLLLAILGAGLLLLCFHSIPSDTAPDSAARQNASIKGYLSVLRSRAFWGHTGAFGFLQGMVFTLMASGSVLFQEQFGLSYHTFQFGMGWLCTDLRAGIVSVEPTLSIGQSAVATRRSNRNAVGFALHRYAHFVAGSDIRIGGGATVQFDVALWHPDTDHDVWRR